MSQSHYFAKCIEGPGFYGGGAVFDTLTQAIDGACHVTRMIEPDNEGGIVEIWLCDTDGTESLMGRGVDGEWSSI